MEEPRAGYSILDSIDLELILFLDNTHTERDASLLLFTPALSKYTNDCIAMVAAIYDMCCIFLRDRCIVGRQQHFMKYSKKVGEKMGIPCFALRSPEEIRHYYQLPKLKPLFKRTVFLINRIKSAMVYAPHIEERMYGTITTKSRALFALSALQNVTNTSALASIEGVSAVDNDNQKPVRSENESLNARNESIGSDTNQDLDRSCSFYFKNRQQETADQTLQYNQNIKDTSEITSAEAICNQETAQSSNTTNELMASNLEVSSFMSDSLENLAPPEEARANHSTSKETVKVAVVDKTSQAGFGNLKYVYNKKEYVYGSESIIAEWIDNLADEFLEWVIEFFGWNTTLVVVPQRFSIQESEESYALDHAFVVKHVEDGVLKIEDEVNFKFYAKKIVHGKALIIATSPNEAERMLEYESDCPVRKIKKGNWLAMLSALSMTPSYCAAYPSYAYSIA